MLNLQGNINRVAQVAGGLCLNFIDNWFVMHFSQGTIGWYLDRDERVYS